MDLTPEELEKAKALAPDAKRFQKVLLSGRVLIFRNPTKHEYKAFRQIYDLDKGEMRAFEALAGTLIVIPTPAEWESDVLLEFPGAGINIDVSKALHNLVGMTSSETSK